LIVEDAEMELRRKLVIAVILILLLGGLEVSGQRKTDPAFNAFWIKFKAAVARNDRGSVADMTKLPFMPDSRDLIVDPTIKNLDRAGFIKRYSSLFTPRVRGCFARAIPGKDQEFYEVFCGEEFFLFARVGGVYKFTEIGVND
jgi:hypothetical protein